ncbi:MAG TPA: hypothetical protein VL068_03310 [Microthrixaceae bacterium]|nr:hypothetical protein [Microthrixaceae bacterium]
MRAEDVESDQFGYYFAPEREVTTIPRGRSTGLLGALAMAIAPQAAVHTLPLTDLDELRDSETMFDYDPELAVDLDVALG